MSEKVKYIKNNFDAHARNWAHALAYRERWTERQMEVVYEAIMNFVDQAVEMRKIEVKDQQQWDEVEHMFRDAMDNEGIKRSMTDGYTA